MPASVQARLPPQSVAVDLRATEFSAKCFRLLERSFASAQEQFLR
jgi:hypothetical protein